MLAGARRPWAIHSAPLIDARWEDVPLPIGDQYYLVRGVNACGPIATQGWGKDSLGNPHLACP